MIRVRARVPPRAAWLRVGATTNNAPSRHTPLSKGTGFSRRIFLDPRRRQRGGGDRAPAAPDLFASRGRPPPCPRGAAGPPQEAPAPSRLIVSLTVRVTSAGGPPVGGMPAHPSPRAQASAPAERGTCGRIWQSSLPQRRRRRGGAERQLRGRPSAAAAGSGRLGLAKLGPQLRLG